MVLAFIAWLGGEGSLVVKTKANVEESTVAGESGLVDWSCFEIQCSTGSTAEAIRPVPMDRIEHPSAEQIVNMSVLRIMKEIAQMRRSHHMSSGGDRGKGPK